MAGIVGYPKAAADGLFVPGGSASNLYAMHIARHKAAPETRTQGLAAAPGLVAFTSAQSHYRCGRLGPPPRTGVRRVWALCGLAV